MYFFPGFYAEKRKVIGTAEKGSIRFVEEEKKRGKEKGAGKPDANGQCSVDNPLIHQSFSFCKLDF
ncbi:MAG TPA: hypothetical protein VK205_03955 [Prolixibacteraceae bacterium]|nr:hypothetical protein [Prolixibacteraceae bacterium]